MTRLAKTIESSLHDFVTKRESVNLAIDADSLLYSACYEFENLEKAYFEFCGRVNSIKQAVYARAERIEQVVLCFTTKTNFRHTIYPEYKKHRRTITDEQRALIDRSKALKGLVYTRVKDWCQISLTLEADDLVIDLANKGWLVSAIDKDVINQCPTDCFNYKKWEWYEALTLDQIHKNILVQAIQGDSTDNIKGVVGMGAVKAKKEVEKVDFDIDKFVSLFPTKDEALMNVRLVSMHYQMQKPLSFAKLTHIFKEL